MPDAPAARSPAPPGRRRARAPVRTRFRARVGARAALAAAALVALLPAGPLAANGSANGSADGTADGAAREAGADSEFLGATWYADGSCSLSVGGRPSVGRTAIDADFDEIGARTLVHCDTEDGRRVTLLSRGGEALALGERAALLAPHEIDEGLDGSIAWLARSGEGFADESAPRRFVLEGRVIIRNTPAALVAGAAPHTDVQPFAELTGRVERVARAPSGSAGAEADGPGSGDAPDRPPEVVTR